MKYLLLKSERKSEEATKLLSKEMRKERKTMLVHPFDSPILVETLKYRLKKLERGRWIVSYSFARMIDGKKRYSTGNRRLGWEEGEWRIVE
jgi:hypothetical protein